MSIELLKLAPEDGYKLTVEGEAVQLKTLSLELLGKVTKIETADDLAFAAAVLSEGARLTKQMEESRVAVKAPLLAAERRIDAMAKEYSAPINSELDRIKVLVGKFHNAEDARVRREREEQDRQRRAEEERQERERQAEVERIEAERNAELERARKEAAAAEERRQAELAAAAPPPEEETVDAEDPLAQLRAQAAEEERREAQALEERQRQEREAEERRLQEIENERQRRIAQIEADRISQQSQVTVAAPTVAKAKGVSSRKFWDFEVTGPHLLYDWRHELVDLVPRNADIRKLVQDGARDIPGVRIFETTATKVRAAQ